MIASKVRNVDVTIATHSYDADTAYRARAVVLLLAVCVSILLQGGLGITSQLSQRTSGLAFQSLNLVFIITAAHEGETNYHAKCHLVTRVRSVILFYRKDFISSAGSLDVSCQLVIQKRIILLVFYSCTYQKKMQMLTSRSYSGAAGSIDEPKQDVSFKYLFLKY